MTVISKKARGKFCPVRACIFENYSNALFRRVRLPPNQGRCGGFHFCFESKIRFDSKSVETRARPATHFLVLVWAAAWRSLCFESESKFVIHCDGCKCIEQRGLVFGSPGGSPS